MSVCYRNSYYDHQHHECVSGGLTKASWIAKTFGVAISNVHHARTFLADELGWLVPREAPQRVLNQFGQATHINLTWQRTVTLAEPASLFTTKLPPPEAEKPELLTTKLPSPFINKNPLQELKNQKPGPDLPAGTRSQAAAPSQTKENNKPVCGRNEAGVWTKKQEGSEGPVPTLRDIKPCDLSHTSRLLTLFEQAHKRKLIGRSESALLTFVSLAERARIRGSSNPGGFFYRLLDRKLYHFITQDDEDSARARLRRHREAHATKSAPLPAVRHALSADAQFVRLIRLRLANAGYRGDVFAAVKRELPEWTRERWESAHAEVTAVRQPAVTSDLSHVTIGR